MTIALSSQLYHADSRRYCYVTEDGWVVACGSEGNPVTTAHGLGDCLLGAFSEDGKHVLLIDSDGKMGICRIEETILTVTEVDSILPEGEELTTCVPGGVGGGFVVSSHTGVYTIDTYDGIMDLIVDGFESEVADVVVIRRSSTDACMLVLTIHELYLVCLGPGDEGTQRVPVFGDGDHVCGKLCVSDDASRCAVAMENGLVCCWKVQDIVTCGKTMMETDITQSGSPLCFPITMKGLTKCPEFLSWKHAEYLIASEGHDCVVWNMVEHVDQVMEDCMVCCGVQQGTLAAITCHPQRALLALLGSDGVISVFDLECFWKGGVRAPLFSVQFLSQFDEDAGFGWRLGGEVYARDIAGHVMAWNAGDILGLEDESEGDSVNMSRMETVVEEEAEGDESTEQSQEERQGSPIHRALGKIRIRVDSKKRGLISPASSSRQLSVSTPHQHMSPLHTVYSSPSSVPTSGTSECSSVTAQTSSNVRPYWDMYYSGWRRYQEKSGQHSVYPALYSFPAAVTATPSGTQVQFPLPPHPREQEVYQKSTSPTHPAGGLHQYSGIPVASPFASLSPIAVAPGGAPSSSPYAPSSSPYAPSSSPYAPSSSPYAPSSSPYAPSSSPYAAPVSPGHTPPTHHPIETTIYLGNLPHGFDESSIASLCSAFGSIFDIQTIRDKDSRMSKGYAFVTFQQPQQAVCAIQALNGLTIHSRFGSTQIKAAPTKRKSKQLP